MSYKEDLFNNALRSISTTYRKSMYNKNIDLYRIYDIANSLNTNQMESKEWLVENLLPFIKKNRLSHRIRRIAVVGSWYGLLGVILRQYVEEDVEIFNIDSDPLSKEIGKILSSENIYKNNFFEIDQAADYLIDKAHTFDLIINTSCEHMEPEDIQLMIKLKNKNALICFQSNNYNIIDSHINTCDTLEDFLEQLNLTHVMYSDSKTFTGVEQYDRYTVIGI